MKTRLFLTLSLLAVLIAACAPAIVTESPVQSAPSVVVIIPSAKTVVENVSPTLAATTQVSVADAPTAFPIATSRGPNLEATDPETVKMASGNLQFVEFFEFW